VGEIAFLLGFSEVSAFTRAFKRWTGVSPREWRNQGDGGPADVTGSADSADPADPADMDEA
jgi:AraC-like DNA-binding protein